MSEFMDHMAEICALKRTIAEVECAIPASFYRDRDLLFRVQQLVAQWRTLTDAVRELSEELEKWQTENAKLKSELLKD